jgi:hypothetical protein
VPEKLFKTRFPSFKRLFERGAIKVSVAADIADVREAELGGKIMALPDRQYGVIFADPEWKFVPWSQETGMDRSADNHYSTSSLDVIAARDVTSIAADDCVLFLCATGEMIREAIGAAISTSTCSSV